MPATLDPKEPRRPKSVPTTKIPTKMDLSQDELLDLRKDLKTKGMSTEEVDSILREKFAR